MKIPGTNFCLRLSRPQGHSAAGNIRSIEKSNELIGIEICDLPSCSIVFQPTTLPRALLNDEGRKLIGKARHKWEDNFKINLG
jgi:hypothetical protein